MKFDKRRILDICVISDIHLGSYGCHAEELNNYIKSINPKILILNGDVFDGYVFNRKYFPKSHFEFIRNVLTILKNGSQVYLISGNHDDFMRNFDEFSMLNLHRMDKLVLTIDDKKYWFFHGDVFDLSMQGKLGKIIASIGGQAYDLLIYFNKWINKLLKKFGRNPYSLSKKVKDSVKKAVVYIQDFEQMSCKHAIKQEYDFVVNGHIHQPSIREYSNEEGSVVYMNSGDWVENLTSLEYQNGEWLIYKYNPTDFKSKI
jgi:UDP-2,3-diacylglucosamine pyrophosphatase LpxH